MAFENVATDCQTKPINSEWAEVFYRVPSVPNDNIQNNELIPR